MAKRTPDHAVNEMLPIGKLLTYGLQHVLAMYIGAVTVPIVISAALGLSSDQVVFLISADLFTCGIASLIQTLGFWKFGIRIPVLQGVTFSCLQPIIAIGLGVEKMGGAPEQAMVLIFTAVIISGLFTMLITPLVSRFIHLFPPLVTGSVLLAVGLTLLPVGINMFGGQNYSPNGEEFGAPGFLLVGSIVMVAILIGNRFLKGFLKNISVLIGIAVGLVASIPFGYIDFSHVAEAAWFGIDLPLGLNFPWHAEGSYFSTYTTEPFLANIIPACISLIVVMVVVMVESTGAYLAVGEIIDLDIEKKDIARGLRADGLATMVGGFLNGMPYTTFMQNVGLVALTRVRSRFVVASAGVILICLGMIPKLAAIFDALPRPVIGGAALVMFATVAVTGIQILTKAELDTKPNNLFVVAVSIAIGMIPTVASAFFNSFPAGLEPILGSGITLTAVSSILLNIFFNGVSWRKASKV
jgi:xanthine permease